MRKLTFLDELRQEESVFFLPGDWNEFRANQLLYLVELVDKKISAEEIKLKMLLFCLKARIRKRNADASFRIKIQKKKFDITTDELFSICSIFDYLFTGKEQIKINPLLVNNPFPVIKIGLIKLYGPDDGFTNYSYEDFMKLQINQSQMIDSDQKARSFVSSLYKLKNGKPSKLFRFVSDLKITAILWFYLGCMNFLQERFPLVFAGNESSSDVVDGQMRIVDALAKNDVTKKKEVRQSDLYEALYTMQIAAEESQKLQDRK